VLFRSLTAKEREKLREHPNIGYALTSPMGLEDRIMKMVRSHHEHFDGSGYPDGLAGGEIPIEARIVSVIDAFRALLSEGPYRRTYTISEARGEIAKGEGSRFDPAVVAAFREALDELAVRVDRNEIILDAFERQLEQERFERGHKEHKILQEAAKEDTR
jgi:HD-GYP domain-containing protein (c-di-GMP phosphodiesterase class II)